MIEVEENVIDELVLLEAKIAQKLKNEFDTELGKNEYPIELVTQAMQNVHAKIISMYIQKTRTSTSSKHSKSEHHQEDYPVSDAQKKFISDLGGDPEKPDTWKEASSYIDALKKKGKGKKQSVFE